MRNLGAIMVIIGLILLVLANVVGLGYGIYLWSSGLLFKIALWKGFVLWVSMILVGLSTFLMGAVFSD